MTANSASTQLSCIFIWSRSHPGAELVLPGHTGLLTMRKLSQSGGGLHSRATLRSPGRGVSYPVVGQICSTLAACNLLSALPAIQPYRTVCDSPHPDW